MIFQQNFAQNRKKRGSAYIAKSNSKINEVKGGRIGIDLTALRKEATGVENYMKGLVFHLLKTKTSHRFFLFTNFQDRKIFGDILPANFSIVPGAFRWRPTRTLFHQILLPIFAKVLDLDVIHSMAFVIPFLCRSQRNLLTVYDMTFFTLQDPVRPPSDLFFRRAVLASIRNAHKITVPSESTVKDMLRIIPDIPRSRIEVAHPGISNRFFPLPDSKINEVRQRLKLPEKYFLYVGTLEPRKNLPRLIKAYRRMVISSRHQEHLVLAGRPGWHIKPLLDEIAAPEISHRVHLLGYVEDCDLPGLYAGARAFVFPSLEEGFGFPPLEAMACGIPTISSNLSSLAENLRGAAKLVSPKSTEEIADALRCVNSDDGLRSRLRREGLKRARHFRWDKTVRQILKMYDELITDRRNERLGRRNTSRKDDFTRSFGGKKVNERKVTPH